MAALSEFSKHVMPVVPGCPAPVAEEAILRACIEFCERSAIVTDAVDLYTVVGVSEYALAFPSELLAHRILYVKRDGAPLTRTGRDEMDSVAAMADPGAPSAYYLAPDNRLVLGPVPEVVEALSVKAVVKPARNATTVPDLLADHWLPEIAAGAKALLFAQKSTAWYDPNEASLRERDFSEAIDKAITQLRAGRSGTPTRVQMRPAA